jgi:hypothetical protein
MIKGFLSIIYNNIISSCYDTNKRNSDFVNVNNNRELFKDEFLYYNNDIKLINIDPCLNDNIKLFDQERNDLLINKKNKDESKEDYKDESKEDYKDESKEDDLSSCCSDIYDKVEDILH